MDDEIIKRKLLIDGDGIGDDRRINILLKSFLKWCDTRIINFNGLEKDNQLHLEEDHLNYQKLIAMISQCEHAMDKSHQIQKMNQKELNNYENLAVEIQQRIENTQIKIDVLKAELKDSKVIRQNKLKYDEIAKTVILHPDRKTTLDSLEKIKKEIDQLNLIKDLLDESYETKKQMFESLINNVYNIQSSLSDEKSHELLSEIQSLVEDDDYCIVKHDSKVEPEIVLQKELINPQHNANGRDEKMDTK